MSVKVIVRIVLIMVVVLGFRFFTYFLDLPVLENGGKVDLETRLTDEPVIKNGRQQFRVKTKEGQKINITTGLTPQYKYGDKISIFGVVKTSEYNGHTFFTMNFPKLQIVNNDHNFIARAAVGVRVSANTLYQKSMPPVSSSLLSGIVFGGDQGLPKNFMEDLRVSGVVHVIAASGMNVTFVAGALIGMLGAFFKRQIAITIAIFGVIFYSFVSGFEPSIVRASIMAVIAFSASLLGRQNFAVGALLITAFVMLFHSPSLISDVGFQLSFLATIGIVAIKPILDSSFNKKIILFKLVGDDLGTTIAAQLATIPVLLAVFGNYGLLSVLVNALVLWTVPILMIIGSVGLILGMIFEPLGKLVLLLAIPIIYYFEKVITYFGNLGWTVSIPEVSPFVWIGYYLLLFSGILLIHQYRSQNKLKRENTS